MHPSKWRWLRRLHSAARAAAAVLPIIRSSSSSTSFCPGWPTWPAIRFMDRMGTHHRSTAGVVDLHRADFTTRGGGAQAVAYRYAEVPEEEVGL